MQYNYYFDICALCIIGTIAIISLARRSVPAYRQRAYSMLISAICISTLSERIETYFQMRPVLGAAWFSYAEKIAGSMYFLAHLLSAACYLFYVMAILDIYIDLRQVKSLLLTVGAYSIGVILVIINWFYPILFYYSEDGIYHRLDLIGIYYVLAGYYLIAAVFLMYRYNKLIQLKTRTVIASYVVLVVVGILLQFLFPTLLIENFCITVSAAMVYITLQNPSEMVDQSLNMLNRKAFLESLDMKIKRKSEQCTIFVSITNIGALSTEIGYTQAQMVLKNVSKFLKSVGYKQFKIQSYAYRFSDYVFAVAVHTGSEQKQKMLIEYIAKRLEEPWNCMGMAIKIEGHCFMVKYPDNYTNTSELMSKLDIIAEDISDNNSIIVDIDSVEFKELRKARDFDRMAKISLDKKTAVIKYQPVLSKIYKINYRADVVCFPVDEDGNEVDIRKHIPDIKVTQALMDTDEFVYRRACRALSFWNAGDKQGKYRAIVGLSQGEISRPDFVRRIKKMLREEKAESSWISMKLTETTLTTMNKVAEHNLRLMGDMNSYIIVDKFGSGYGDLDRILSLPVLQVNLDISVVRMARESEKMRLVAEGMVNLFHDVSIFVGASEIETKEDKEMAEELGCDFLIGDYMGEPMQDSSFARFIDAYFEEG